MGKVLQWPTLVNLLFSTVVAVIGAVYVRAYIATLSRDDLMRTLDELRDQIADRDRTSLGLREEIKGLNARVEQITAEVERRQGQVAFLLEENLELKRQLGAHPPRKRHLSSDS